MAQETQKPSDLYPCARKSDKWEQKNHQSSSKTVFLFEKTHPGSGKERALTIKFVLEDISIYHSRLLEKVLFLIEK